MYYIVVGIRKILAIYAFIYVVMVCIVEAYVLDNYAVTFTDRVVTCKKSICLRSNFFQKPCVIVSVQSVFDLDALFFCMKRDAMVKGSDFYANIISG
jgi:hypothetical protein